MTNDSKLIFEAYQGSSTTQTTTSLGGTPPVQVAPPAPEEENPHCTYQGSDPLVKQAMQAASQMDAQQAQDLLEALAESYNKMEHHENANFNSRTVAALLTQAAQILQNRTGN